MIDHVSLGTNDVAQRRRIKGRLARVLGPSLIKLITAQSWRLTRAAPHTSKSCACFLMLIVQTR